MPRHPGPLFLVTLIGLAAPAFAEPDPAVPPPPLRVIVHAENPAASLSREEVAAFFLLADAQWADGTLAEPVHQLAASPIRAAFSEAAHGKSAAAVRRHLAKAQVRARTPPPELDGDRAVVDWVRSRRGAVGYVSLKAPLPSGVKTLEIDWSEESDEEDDGEKPERVSLVLDASGSMRAHVDGRSKFDVARDVILELLEDWDMEIDLGLTVYGHRNGTCEDVETVVPVGLPRPGAVAAALDAVHPRGSTPLTRAVTMAAGDLARAGSDAARVVLVSDGQETCGLDPCTLAAKTAELGVELTAYVVGFDVLRNGKAQAELRCLARQTGGTFQLAWDAHSLRSALRVALARATGKVLPVEEPAVAEREDEEPRLLDLTFQLVPRGEVRVPDPRGKERILRIEEDFWITETEISQGDWRRVMGTRPSFSPQCGEDCPVERVCFFDALAFANRLSELDGRQPCYRLEGCTGKPGSGCREGYSCTGGLFCQTVAVEDPSCTGYRLPTPEEWEYAARAGTDTPFHWGSELTDVDASCARASGVTPVRSFAPNYWGLYDMHGNVWEWVGWSQRGLKQYKPQAEDDRHRRRSRRVAVGDDAAEWIMGGAASTTVSECQADSRRTMTVGTSNGTVGFRLVTTQP